MSIVNTLKKRRHVAHYNMEDIPSKDTINYILWKAWKSTPSKNNFMPYKVNVLGPDKEVEKRKIYDKVVENHLYYDELGLATDNKHITDYQFHVNPNYKHIQHNPYLLIFNSRVCDEPNEYYKMQVEEHGHFAEQCNKDFIIPIAESTSVEVGLFAQTVTTLCLEENIDVSYTACFPKDMTKWKDIPYVQFGDGKARVLLLMSIGKGKVYRKRHNKDRKPDFHKVVNWI